MGKTAALIKKLVVAILEGDDRSLADCRGGIGLADFWAMWRKSRLETMPRWQKAHSAHAARSIAFLDIFMDRDEKRTKK